MLTNIIKPGFHDLKYLISKTSLISKTMVFVNKIDNRMAIAAYFYYLLLLKNQDQADILVKTFYSNLKTYIWLEFIEDFWNRKTRIFICTNAIGMYINISNIMQII